jgi:hypothetical protein
MIGLVEAAISVLDIIIYLAREDTFDFYVCKFCAIRRLPHEP